MTQISVIVATYNWPAALELCLQSLKNQSFRDFEILIADDGSQKETREVIQKCIKQTNIHTNKRPIWLFVCFFCEFILFFFACIWVKKYYLDLILYYKKKMI